MAKGIIRFFRSLVTNWLEDFLILLGVLVILITTYRTYGNTVGNYTLGLILLIFGLLLARRE